MTIYMLVDIVYKMFNPKFKYTYCSKGRLFRL